MFEGLLSKFKKGSNKKGTPKINKVDVADDDGKSGKFLMFASIGLILIGVAAIAFEYVTTSDTPMPQQTVPKPPIKPALAAKPASAPTVVNK